MRFGTRPSTGRAGIIFWPAAIRTSNAVTDVIVTHLHYDHAGNLDLLPQARIHIQERELHYAVGCNMCRPGRPVEIVCLHEVPSR